MERAASVLRLALHHQVSVLLGTAAPSAFLSLRAGRGEGVWDGMRRGEGLRCRWSRIAAASFKVSRLV